MIPQTHLEYDTSTFFDSTNQNSTKNYFIPSLLHKEISTQKHEYYDLSETKF